MKSRRKTWLSIASDNDLLMIYNLYQISYMSLEPDKYDKLAADIKKEIEYRQMLKKSSNK